MRIPTGERFKRILYLTAGTLLILIGIIGLALPVFPTLPFLFLGLLCFMKVSEKLKVRIRKNRLYKKYLAKYERDGKLPLRLMIISGIIFLIFTAFLLAALSAVYYYAQKFGGFYPFAEKIKTGLCKTFLKNFLQM